MIIQRQKPDVDLERKKPLKVKLPLKHHLLLHKLRLITGKNMSQAVQEALELYLETMLASKEKARDALAGHATKSKGATAESPGSDDEQEATTE